jgi:1,4-dihydroxy-2-naphthoate octaprenyltransferase
LFFNSGENIKIIGNTNNIERGDNENMKTSFFMKEEPNILKMTRAQFLIGILIPLFAGTMIAVSISNSFSLTGFLLALIIGIGLHIATNVYNDIYDTIQGVDKKESKTRNYYSGGSGILQKFPHLTGKMFMLARLGLILSFSATIGLLFIINQSLWPLLISIYITSAFLSKYYTAPPFKLGYRGIGEITVWLGFGPLAIALAALSQNIGFHFTIIAVMPVTGFSTLLILWIGQMLDIKNDVAAGKIGLVARLKSKQAYQLYIIIIFLLIINILGISLFVLHPGWPVLFSLLPFCITPFIWMRLRKFHNNPIKVIPSSKLNSLQYLLFSIMFNVGIYIYLIIES